MTENLTDAQLAEIEARVSAFPYRNGYDLINADMPLLIRELKRERAENARLREEITDQRNPVHAQGEALRKARGRGDE